MTVILVLAAIAVPPLLNNIDVANETAAAAQIRNVHAAQATFYSHSQRFAKDLAELGGLIPKRLASGKANGYVFSLRSSEEGYTITAVPEKPGKSSYYSDQLQIIHRSDGPEPATAESPELGK